MLSPEHPKDSKEFETEKAVLTQDPLADVCSCCTTINKCWVGAQLLFKCNREISKHVFALGYCIY